MVSVFAVLQVGQVSVDSRMIMINHAKTKPSTVNTAPRDRAPMRKPVVIGRPHAPCLACRRQPNVHAKTADRRRRGRRRQWQGKPGGMALRVARGCRATHLQDRANRAASEGRSTTPPRRRQQGRRPQARSRRHRRWFRVLGRPFRCCRSSPHCSSPEYNQHATACSRYRLKRKRGPLTATQSAGMQIGELARQSGCNVETIRYYERVGLLPAPPRSAGRYRLYDSPHVRRLAFLRRARELGFTLDQVRALLALSAKDGRDACAEVHNLAAEHLTEEPARIPDLAAMERILW